MDQGIGFSLEVRIEQYQVLGGIFKEVCPIRYYAYFLLGNVEDIITQQDVRIRRHRQIGVDDQPRRTVQATSRIEETTITLSFNYTSVVIPSYNCIIDSSYSIGTVTTQ